MFKEISVTTAKLNYAYEVAYQIDYALQQCWIQSKSAYLTLPTDIVQTKIEGERLKTPIDLAFPTDDPDKKDYVVDVVLKYFLAAKNPVILVYACTIRYKVIPEVHDLLEQTQLHVFVTPVGK